MASKTVNEILQAERQADLAVEQGSRAGKGADTAGAGGWREPPRRANESARQEADVLRRETKEQAEEILRKMEQEGYRQASALRDGVQAKQLGAATTVIRCIIPQYPIEGRRSDGKM